MGKIKSKNTFNSFFIAEDEHMHNTYVMRCFAVSMLLYSITFLLNILGIFIVDSNLMRFGFTTSLIIYVVVYLITKKLSQGNPITKYFAFFGIILTFTIMGVTITYHVVLTSVLPLLYSTIYSSKKFKWYVYVLTVISTFITVYGGYYWGLCDANMALITTGTLSDYVVDGQFTLTTVNENPGLTLFLFFVLPRCLIYIAFVSICNSIFNILNRNIERARLADELEKAKIEAERANRAKSQFLARMSHEIRTPINAVLGMNEMILRESDQPNIYQYACDVKDSSVMLMSIINDILDSSKIESGMMEIVPVNYETGNFLNNLYNMISIKAREKGLELIFDVDKDIPSELYGDDKRISQILINLLSNAVKYTEKGKITFSLRSEINGDNAILNFSVKDTGIGIKPEDIEKIYDEYRRVDEERNRNVEGSGLGMSIVRNLLKLMGSELGIKSEYEKGSEFFFSLEQKIVNAAPTGDFREKNVKPSENVTFQSSFTAPKARVLVVDDYRMNLKVMRALMKQTKIRVISAESGEMCIDLLKKDKFDLIFLDHMMPGMDGIETLRIIRDEKLCDGVPVVMLTANAVSGNKEKYISEGFDDFLAKPVMPEKLDKILLSHLPERLIIMNPENTSPIEKTAARGGGFSEKLRHAIPEIDSEYGLKICVGDEEFYEELFGDFVNLDIRDKLNAALAENDFNTYCVHVHGFKNNAYSIGAKELGDMAFEMEKMTREEMPSDIAEKQRLLFECYDSICTRFNQM